MVYLIEICLTWNNTIYFFNKITYNWNNLSCCHCAAVSCPNDQKRVVHKPSHNIIRIEGYSLLIDLLTNFSMLWIIISWRYTSTFQLKWKNDDLKILCCHFSLVTSTILIVNVTSTILILSKVASFNMLQLIYVCTSSNRILSWHLTKIALHFITYWEQLEAYI